MYKRIEEAARMVASGAAPRDVAGQFSKPVAPEDIKQWAVDWSNLGQTAFRAKYGSKNGISRSTGSRPALSLKDMSQAARNEAHRLEVLERQLEQQLQGVRGELRNVRELLTFLDRREDGAEA